MRVALVNNMPDGAFLDTERQFRAALGGETVEFALYAIAEIPRRAEVGELIARSYRGLEQLFDSAPDALIVTGTEPAQAGLIDEPYWPALARLLEWASGAVANAMLSCLAAHVSILLFDGVERRPRPRKLCGVYDNDPPETSHALTLGMSGAVPMPHSRINDVDEADLSALGYQVLLRSEQTGWSLATRRHRRCTFVLCQGHPEYSRLSLLGEYRRDIRRSLFSRGSIRYPPLPQGYMGLDGDRLARDFETSASEQLRRGADPASVYERFPFDALAAAVSHRWAPASSTLYRNWLRAVRSVNA